MGKECSPVWIWLYRGLQPVKSTYLLPHIGTDALFTYVAMANHLIELARTDK